ncbi:hypothetical protein RB594_006113 [Gaeumannomyces avenae]
MQPVAHPAPAAAAQPAAPLWMTLQNTFRRSPSKPSYPPISSIPRTPATRLQRASPPDIPDRPVPAPAAAPEPTPSGSSNNRGPDGAAADTVLYLAYGSNLAAATFLGVRGIRPVSQVNVRAPSLRLVFDLPGLPYLEPCFANTAVRKLPKLPQPPKLPNPPPAIPVPPPRVQAGGEPAQPTTTATTIRTNSHGDPVWDGGLFGVVYEVTRDDYATIIRTEGGGSSYRDILVPCLELPPSVTIPEKPGPVPELPRPFLAHTLFVPPAIPTGGGDHDGDGDASHIKFHGGDDEKPTLPWWSRFLAPNRRPDPERAQPSARYLALIRDGAREHDLPADYVAWLDSLACYTATSPRQTAAQLLVQLFFLPPLIALMIAANLAVKWRKMRRGDKGKDDSGRHPLWAQVGMGMWTAAVWWAHDRVLRPLFGDGERTEELRREGEVVALGPRRMSRASRCDEETALLGGREH